MSKYYFNVVDGQQIRDTEGSELDSRDEVRAVALATASELLRGISISHFWGGEAWKMIVTDRKGVEVLTLSFAASEPPYAFPANQA